MRRTPDATEIAFLTEPGTGRSVIDVNDIMPAAEIVRDLVRKAERAHADDALDE
jgi:hypothetical protein